MMRKPLALAILAIAAAFATVATVFVIQADLPAGETAGKIGLAWLSPLTALAVISSRRTRRATGQF